MNFKELKNEIKEQQKLLARQIRRGKYFRKPKNQVNLTEEDISNYFWKTGGGTVFYDSGKVNSLRHTYRHCHIAYCMFFNKTPYEKIETCKEKLRRPNQSFIDDEIKYFEKKLDAEVICDCA